MQVEFAASREVAQHLLELLNTEHLSVFYLMLPAEYDVTKRGDEHSLLRYHGIDGDGGK